MRTNPQSSSLATRAPAAVTAGVLAFSAVLPPVALAEQDQTDDGNATVTQNAGGDPDQGASFDPGGDTAELPDAPPAPAVSSVAPAPDPGAADDDDPVVDSGDGTDPQAEAPAPVTKAAPAASAAEPAVPPPAAPAAPAAAPPTDAPAPAAPAAAPAPVVAPAPVRPAVRAVTVKRKKVAHRKHVHRRVQVVSRPVRVAPVAAPVTAVVQSRPVTSKAIRASVPAALRAKPGDRTHTVHPGESLWTIATDLLGSRAGSSMVAREVRLLWARNHARIGTGDPDVLLVGTKLMLRSSEES